MKSENGLQNQLKAIRTRLGMSQQELAAAAGIARQTIGGIEAELYAPSAVVALRIAKALGCRVEDIFWLEGSNQELEAFSAEGFETETLQRVTLAKIADRWVAHPLHGQYAFRTEMIPADGVGTWNQTESTVRVSLLDDPEALARTVVIAGCTPSLSLWARSAERWFPGLRVQWLHANSMQALHALSRGEVHAAGIHLYDTSADEFNAPFVRKILPARRSVLVNLGVWNEGFIVQAGNPKNIVSAFDLTRPDVELINREEGAGSRQMLDDLIQSAGVSRESIMGYSGIAHSHQDVAVTVASGLADVGVSTESVAITYGLGFVPLRNVHYDLAIIEEYMEQEPVRQLLSTLQHRWVRSQLSVLGGFDTSCSGQVTPVDKAL